MFARADLRRAPGVDAAGEWLADALGITSSKYQYVVDEVARMQDEMAAEAAAESAAIAAQRPAQLEEGSGAPPPVPAAAAAAPAAVRRAGLAGARALVLPADLRAAAGRRVARVARVNARVGVCVVVNRQKTGAAA
jgi:hypothetical protein